MTVMNEDLKSYLDRIQKLNEENAIVSVECSTEYGMREKYEHEKKWGFAEIVQTELQTITLKVMIRKVSQ